MELRRPANSSESEADRCNYELVQLFILERFVHYGEEPETAMHAVDWDAIAGSESLEQAIGRSVVIAELQAREKHARQLGTAGDEGVFAPFSKITWLVSGHKRTASALITGTVIAIALVASVVASLGGASPAPRGKTADIPTIKGNAQLVRGTVPSAFTAAAPATTTLDLPAATAPPAPDPPSLAEAAPLRSHEVFGFAPYWTLSQSGGFDVNQLSTLAYFSIDVNADGTLDESGPGWDGYQSQALTDLVTRAHTADDRVVITVTDFDQNSLNKLTSSPTASATLANALIGVIRAKNLDGVNLDFEGDGSSDQVGLTNLVTQVSAAMHGVNANYQVTMDTYASAAGDSSGFYNIRALAPAVNAFFVMSYQLNLQSTASTESPLTSTAFSEKTAIDQYAAIVPPSKVILGMPFFGIDWPTSDGTLTAQASGQATTVPYDQVMASGHPIYWDATTQTGWTSYQVGTQWHETFFEVPSSLYDAAQLATSSGLGGIGIWALGMDGNDPNLVSALSGFPPAVKTYTAGPATTSQSSTTSTSTTSTTTTSVPDTTTSSTSPASTTPTDPASTTSTSTTTSSTNPTSTTTTSTDPGSISTSTTSTSTPSNSTTTSTDPTSTTSTFNVFGTPFSAP
jgi:GH18 family chitinase